MTSIRKITDLTHYDDRIQRIQRLPQAVEQGRNGGRRAWLHG
jgi:hypothetical protein